MLQTLDLCLIFVGPYTPCKHFSDDTNFSSIQIIFVNYCLNPYPQVTSSFTRDVYKRSRLLGNRSYILYDVIES